MARVGYPIRCSLSRPGIGAAADDLAGPPSFPTFGLAETAELATVGLVSNAPWANCNGPLMAKLRFSCVIDDKPLFRVQAFNWVWTLWTAVRPAPDDLVICLVRSDASRDDDRGKGTVPFSLTRKLGQSPALRESWSGLG